MKTGGDSDNPDSMPLAERYPKPGKTGGTLLRRMVVFLRARKVVLPLTSDILIAVSGGADSLALLVLLARYGRRIVPKGRLHAIHVNHGWRGEESRKDAEFVADLCTRLDVPLVVRELETSYLRQKGASWEERARALRKEAFVGELARRPQGARVWTAHQADDLAETVLWRLFTGTAGTHGGGILFDSSPEQRPLLFARRSELEAFLREEGQQWLNDPSNEDPRFLRAAMRKDLLPRIEALFPRAVGHLTQLALALQDGVGVAAARHRNQGTLTSEIPLAELFGVTGPRLRRANWAEIEKAQRSERAEVTVLLPEGWELKRIRKRAQKGAKGLTGRRGVTKLEMLPRGTLREQWILERVVESSREKDNLTK